MKNKLFPFLLFSLVPFSVIAAKSNDSIAYTQRNFEESFQDKYNGSDFQYETVTKTDLSAWERFWAAVWRKLGDLFSFADTGGALNGLEIVFKIVAFAIIGLVIYLIVRIILKKEGRWIFGKSAKKILVTENVEENIHTIDFNSIIKNATSQKDYRVAVRYYYLWLLKTLSDKNIIEWDIEKTNSDYLREISNSELKKEFRFLSYIYEYSWYGEFELNEEDFSKAQNAFIKNIK